MEKFYKGNAPTGDEWVKVLIHKDKAQVEWFVFRKGQAHTQEWATYKVVANGRAKHKGNYWFAKNEATGQLGFARDMVLMRENHLELHQAIEKYLDHLKKD